MIPLFIAAVFAWGVFSLAVTAGLATLRVYDRGQAVVDSE